MKDPKYSFKAFDTFIGTKSNLKDKQIVEIGPGDSINTAIIANAFGAERIYLIDKGSFAVKRMSTYKEMYNLLETFGVINRDLPISNFHQILVNSNATYMTKGILDMSKIANNSIDIIFSNAVLEHMDPDQISLMMFETYRVLRFGCSAKHRIDLRDHINDEFNHLRFSNRAWNSKYLRKGGTNLNRMHISEYVHLAETAGLSCQIEVNGPIIRSTQIKIHESLEKWQIAPEVYSGFDLICTKN